MEENRIRVEDVVFYIWKPHIPVGECSNSSLTFYLYSSREHQLQDLSRFYSQDPAGLLSKLTKSLMPKNTSETNILKYIKMHVLYCMLKTHFQLIQIRSLQVKPTCWPCDRGSAFSVNNQLPAHIKYLGEKHNIH